MAGYGIETVLSNESLAILLYTFVIQSFRFGGIWSSKEAPLCIPLKVVSVAVGGKGTILGSSSRSRQKAVWPRLNFAGCHVDFFSISCFQIKLSTYYSHLVSRALFVTALLQIVF